VKIRKVLWITGLFLVVSLSILVLHISTNTDEFSRYNLQWNGTSDFFASLDKTGSVEIREISGLEGRTGSLLLVIAPERPFAEWECIEVLDFLARGNIVFLADEGGSGNTLLEGIGSSIRIVPANLTSVDRYYDDPSSVIAYPSSPDPFNSGIENIVMNRPSHTKGGTPLFVTSLLTWVDGNDNGRIDETEELGRYPVLSRESIGNGTLYVLSDPSLFINGMQDIGGDNRNFCGKFTSYDNYDLLVEQDHSRTAKADLLVKGIVYMKSSKFMRILVFVVIGAIASLIGWKRFAGIS
jgi:hypothetical protein